MKNGLIAVLILFSACAHAPLTPEELLANNIAIIEGDGMSISILKVDESTTKEIAQRSFYRGPQLKLGAGEHRIAVEFRDQWVGGVSVYDFLITVEAGHKYMIRHELLKHGVHRGASVWIVDSASGKIIGKITASKNEPVTDRVPVLDQSDVFTFPPGQGENWWISSRGKTGLLMTRTGDDPQTYKLRISVYKIPGFQKSEEFLAYVKRERLLTPENDRIEHLEESVEPFPGQIDFCVRIHHRLLDKWGGVEGRFETLQRAGPMILETYEYYCRIPSNKNLAIDFAYSYQYFEGRQDPGLHDRAEKAFAQLKF